MNRGQRLGRRFWPVLIVGLVSSARVSAQETEPYPTPSDPGFGPYGPQHPAEMERGDRPHRAGFTILLGLGVGIQAQNPSEGESESDVGLGGLNLGLGGFLTPDLALLFRTMGTVTFDEPSPGVDFTQVSGVAGPAVQYWVVDRLRLEGGVGFAFVSRELSTQSADVRLTATSDEGGWGLLLGAAVAFWQNERHSVTFGLDYAPAFLEETTLHNLGILFGWQLH